MKIKFLTNFQKKIWIFLPPLEPASSTQQYSPMNERVGGGFQRVPTDATPRTSPIYSQYSPINEKFGGGCQRVPTDAGTFAEAKVRLAKVAQYIATFRLAAVAPYL